MPENKFSTHPDYDVKRDDWQTYQALHQGRHDTLSSANYLWRHEFEENLAKGGGKLRQIREQRTRYVNLITPIVNSFVALIFKTDPDLEEVRKVLDEEEIADFDGNGTNLINFLRNEVAFNYFLYGKPIVQVDTMPMKANSRGEEIAAGLRPFADIWSPLDLKDWQIETIDPKRKGKYNAMRFEYTIIEDRGGLMEAPVQRRYSTIIESDGTTVTAQHYAGELISRYAAMDEAEAVWTPSGEAHVIEGQSEIPVVLDNIESWIKAVSPVALLRHNTQSSLDNGLLYQAHQRLVGIGEFKEGDAVIMNEAGIMFLPEGSTLETIQPSDPSALERRLNALTARMFQIAFSRVRLIPSDSKETQAADAQQEEDKLLVAQLRAASKDLSDNFTQIIKVFAELKGQTFDGRIELDDNITSEDITQQIVTLQAHWDEIVKYPEWRKAINKKLAMQMHLDEIEDITNEIDEGPKEAASMSQDRLSGITSALDAG